MRRLLLALACTALAACDGAPPTAPAEDAAPRAAAAPRTVTLNTNFDVRVGETVNVSGESLSVRFDSVPSDSRCPTGVQCVWAGNAQVRVTLSKVGSAPGTLNLNTTLDPRKGAYLNYEVELVGLAPYPSSKTTLRYSDYRATLVVRKTGVALNQSFNLKAFQSATVSGEGLTVRFDTVVSDSRCPSDVQCFWEGNAEVQVTLTKTGSPSQTFVLNTALEPKKATYGVYEVELLGLAPTPISTSSIASGDYVATLVVRKP